MWLYELQCHQFNKKRAQFEKQNFEKQNLQPQFSNQELSAVRETPELHYGMCSINSASARHVHRIHRSFPSHHAFGPPSTLECLLWCCSAVKKTKAVKSPLSSAALTQGFYFQAVRLCARRRVPRRGFFKSEVSALGGEGDIRGA